MSKKIVMFSDVHIPHHDETAVKILLYAIAWIQPDEVICGGDLLDCTYWSKHPKTFGQHLGVLEDDLQKAISLLQAIQAIIPKAKLVFLEGNHEARLYRWCAENIAGESLYPSLAIRLRLPRAIPGLVYIPYANPSADKAAYYPINDRMVAVHGWCYGKYAIARHLDQAQGKSIIFGHTHRGGYLPRSLFYDPDQVVHGMDVGCLCKKQAFWQTHRPSEWVNCFGVIFCGKQDDDVALIKVNRQRAVIQGQVGVRATGYEPIGKTCFTSEEKMKASIATIAAKKAIQIWDGQTKPRPMPLKKQMVSSPVIMRPVILWGPH